MMKTGNPSMSFFAVGLQNVYATQLSAQTDQATTVASRKRTVK